MAGIIIYYSFGGRHLLISAIMYSEFLSSFYYIILLLSKKSAGKTCWLGLGSLRDRDRGPREPDRDLGARYRRIGRCGGHRGKNNNNISSLGKTKE